MILLNDRFIEREDAIIDIEDRGYQFGDGVYEVIRVYNGVCFLMKPHMERLERSAASIELALPDTIEKITGNLMELVRKDGINNGSIYVQVTRGSAIRAHQFPENASSVLVAYTNVAERPMDKINHGIHTILTDDIRWLRCDIKSLNLLGNVLAKQKAKKHGCDEAILHRGETVSEGSSSNVYIVKDNTVFTHPVNNLILNGITRMEVLRLAKENGCEIKEEVFSVGQLLDADEAFITSTTMEITPVIKINDTTIGKGVPGAVTKELQKAFEESIKENCYQSV